MLNLNNAPECQNASFEEVHKALLALPNTHSPRKNPDIFVRGLKAYIKKIYGSSGDMGVPIETSLVSFNKILKKFEAQQVLLYNIDRTPKYYWNADQTYEIESGSLSSNVYALYVSRLINHPERVNPEPYMAVLQTLSDMADDVKYSDFTWKFSVLKRADETINRPADPVFEKLVSLYGLTLCQNPPKAKYYQHSSTEHGVIDGIFKSSAKSYLDILYTQARAENKIAILNSWVRAAITNGGFEGNALVAHTQDELLIQKEHRQVKDVIKNYNKKEIKKKAKEKNTLAELQAMIAKSNSSMTNTSSSLETPVAIDVKPKKFKL